MQAREENTTPQEPREPEPLRCWLIPFRNASNQYVLVGAHDESHAFDQADQMGEPADKEDWIPVEGFAWDTAFDFVGDEPFIQQIDDVQGEHGILFDMSPRGNWPEVEFEIVGQLREES